MRVDLIATHPHYLDHIYPVWLTLPDEIRGSMYGGPGIEHPGVMSLRDARRSVNMSLCAGIGDTRRNAAPAILMEHGCGQSYGGDRSARENSAFAGGSGRGHVAAFLSTNEQCAARDRARYPHARVDVIGSPYLQHLRATIPTRTVPNPKPVVAIAGHWPMGVSNEGLSAWGEFHTAFAALADDDDYVVVGHGHPRVLRSLAPHYARMGVDVVDNLPDVLAVADVFVCDNSSSQFFAAGLGIPNVVLDSKWYRRGVDHGGRFWDWADIGPRITDPDALPAAVRQALNTRPWPATERILADVFPVDDAVGAAVDVITEMVIANTPLTRR